MRNDSIPAPRRRRSRRGSDEAVAATGGFTAIELIVAVILFSAAMSGMLYMSKAVRDHQVAMSSSAQQNAYATFQSEVALQGIDPSKVGNQMAASINQAGVGGTTVSLGANTSAQIYRGREAAFEIGAVSSPVAAQRNLGGSATVTAVSYSVSESGRQSGGADVGNGMGLGRGAGVGFGVETVGPAVVSNAIPLAPPIFNAFFNQATNDLTNAPFPLNNIATFPTSNPPGTTYRYTTDGSTPTAASPLWDNNPGWTTASFPAQVTLAAFNSDPQYATSVPVTAAFYMDLVVSFSRADARTMNVYGFSLADIGDPTDTGIVLTTNVPGYDIAYTMDGTNPLTSGTAFSGPFSPTQAQFTPSVTLNAVATSNDARVHTSSIAVFTLTTVTSPLSPPTFITSNASPLSPGTPVVLSVDGSAIPRTEVNNGAPTNSSSTATSFPLN